MDKQRLFSNFSIATEAVLANRVRSMLTALGIIFGVAAVIAMLAIGNGAQREVLEQIKLVGVNNIIIKPIVEQTEENLAEQEEAAGKEKRKFSPGLTLHDKVTIRSAIPGIQTVSPEILIDTYIINNGVRRSAKLIGVEPSYFDIFSFQLAEGKMFNNTQLEKGEAVCIIGKSIKSRFFPSENPIGKYLKCGPNWLKVIGVLEERLISESSITKLGIRDYNMDVYTPLQTVLVRYKNRSILTEEMIRSASQGSRVVFFGRGSANTEPETTQNKNYHQLDRLVVQVDETSKLNATADVIVRMLERKHNEVVDYEIEIPELLLKQQQRTNDIFSYVLGAIAGISLIVGGIGIMNIMLASVLERIKEIGLRLSIGAKKSDIINQFMFESMMISFSGGLIGILLGVFMALAVSRFADIPTVISFGSILISFGVAIAIGLIFGIFPARKAALQDPITSLRYE